MTLVDIKDTCFNFLVITFNIFLIWLMAMIIINTTLDVIKNYRNAKTQKKYNQKTVFIKDIETLKKIEEILKNENTKK